MVHLLGKHCTPEQPQTSFTLYFESRFHLQWSRMGLNSCRSPVYTKRLILEILYNSPSVEEEIIPLKKGNWFRWLLKDCSL